MKDLFLQMVRLGIGHQSYYSPGNNIDWRKLKALADRQGLSAIVIDGIEKIPDGQRPSKDLTLQWIGEVLQNYEGRYVSYEKTIGELAGFYAKHGIKMMVLKGYGLSLNYPNPKHRPCGDIDTWNFGRQIAADEAVSKEYGIKIDRSEHHHTVFYWNDFMVENHYDFLIVSASKSNGQIEPLLKELGQDDGYKIEVEGNDVYLPSPNLNALFLLRHILNHFAAIGLSVHHLLDWGFFWEKDGDKVDWDWFKGVLRQYHMYDFFNIINAICVDNLGFEAGIFPIVQFSPDVKERVLKDTLSPEFDNIDALRPGLARRVLFKYKRWKANAWKRKLCFEEGEWSSFWMSVWMHLLKPRSI